MKKYFSRTTIIFILCMVTLFCAIDTDTKVSMKKSKKFEVLAATEDLINENGTFHDNSWDGVSLKKIDASKDDSKKNLVHDFKAHN